MDNELDFDRLIEQIDKKQEDLEVPNFSFTLNGKEKVVAKKPVFDRLGNSGKEKWEEKILGTNNTESEIDVPSFSYDPHIKPIKIDFEAVRNNSLGEEAVLEESSTIKVPKEQKEELKKVTKWLQVSIATLLVAISIGIVVPKEIKESTYEKPIGINIMAEEEAKKSMYSIGDNIANRLIEEKKQYEALGKPYNIDHQLRIYLGVAYNKIVGKTSYSNKDAIGIIDTEEGHFQYEDWMSKIYNSVNLGLKSTMDLPDTLESYLLYATGLEDPYKALKVLGSEVDALTRNVKNPAYETEKEYNKAR